MSLKLFIVFIACLQFTASQTYDKVNLTYVYEARCPFCLQFLSSEFYSGYTTLSEYINLELVLRTFAADNGTITCQHGENECFISRAQACAYHRPGVTQALEVEYLHCTEAKAQKGEQVVDSDIEACVNSVLTDVVSYETVQTCMSSNESDNLLKTDIATGSKYGVTFVPWLALFGKYDDKTEAALRADFVGTICSLLANPPDVCNK